MGIAKTTIFHGPNLYSRQGVVVFRLAGIEASPDLLEFLPGLSSRDMGCGTPGCIESVSGDDPGWIGHQFEHACIELQRMAGEKLSCIRGHGLRLPASGCAAVPYEESAVCIEAARWVADFWARLPATDTEPAFDPAARLEKFLALSVRAMLPVQDRAVIKRARELDVPVTQLVGRILALGQGFRQQRVSATKTSRTNVVGNDLAANKAYSRKVLDDLGLPVPQFERVYRRRDAVTASRRIDGSIVIKPNDGSMGRGISIGTMNRREVKAAYNLAREFSRSVLIEEFVEGFDYRMLVIDGKLCAAANRVPAHVVGDGRQTIEELVAEINRDPRRGSGPTFSWTRIELDDRADKLIKDSGYSRQSIPSEGERLFLRRNANTSDGGTAVDVTDDVHPDNRMIAVTAAKAMGLDIAGVDILTRDISTSILKNGGKICEVNSRPGIRKHLWPAEGTARDVTTPIIKMLFPANRPSRIPVVAVIGTGDVEGAGRILSQLLTAGGHHVGMATKTRLLSGTRVIADGDFTAPEASRRLMLDPDLTVAVLEVTPQDVAQHGLGCDVYDLALIVNADSPVGEEAAKQIPDALLDAFRVVAGNTRGAVLIDADDSAAGVVSEACGAVAQICRLDSAREKKDALRVRFEPTGPGGPLEGAAPLDLPVAVQLGTLLAAVAAQWLGQEPAAIYRRLTGQS